MKKAATIQFNSWRTTDCLLFFLSTLSYNYSCLCIYTLQYSATSSGIQSLLRFSSRLFNDLFPLPFPSRRLRLRLQTPKFNNPTFLIRMQTRNSEVIRRGRHDINLRTRRLGRPEGAQAARGDVVLRFRLAAQMEVGRELVRGEFAVHCAGEERVWRGELSLSK